MFVKILISIVLANLILGVRASSNSSVELNVHVHCRKAIQEAGPTCRELNEKGVTNNTGIIPIPVGKGDPKTAQVSECCALVQVIDCLKDMVKVNLLMILSLHLIHLNCRITVLRLIFHLSINL